MASSSSSEPYGLSKAQILKDLGEERPQWILSSYGPGKEPPEQLFGGYPIEQSPEELRLHHLKGVVAGNPQGAANDIDNLYGEAQRRIQNAVNNVDAAMRFICDAENKHPNRIDVCKANSPAGGTTGAFAVGRPQPFATGSAFGGGAAAPAAGAFGQPSAIGQKPSPFGTSAFSQQARPAGSAFGQTSSLGNTTSPFSQQTQTAGSAFGQATTLGQKPSPFGTSAFSQASGATSSPFAQAAQPSSAAVPAFGQATQPGAGGGGFSAFAKLGGGSAFGQPTSLGQKPSPFGGGSAASPFASVAGAGPSTATSSPFGQPVQSSANPFGGPSAPAAASSPFGQPSTTAASNPFGQPSAAANPFSQQKSDVSMISQQKSDVSMSTSGMLAPSPFGQPSGATASTNPNPFGAPKASASPFAQPATSNPFGAGLSSPVTLTSQASPPADSGGASNSPYAPNATRQHPKMESYSSRDASGMLRMFKGKSVIQEIGKDGKPHPVVQNFNGLKTRIWFPTGPPAYDKDTELDDAAYSPETKAAYEQFVRNGSFTGGVMPVVPPKREWCLFDF